MAALLLPLPSHNTQRLKVIFSSKRARPCRTSCQVSAAARGPSHAGEPARLSPTIRSGTFHRGAEGAASAQSALDSDSPAPAPHLQMKEP